MLLYEHCSIALWEADSRPNGRYNTAKFRRPISDSNSLLVQSIFRRVEFTSVVMEAIFVSWKGEGHIFEIENDSQVL